MLGKQSEMLENGWKMLGNKQTNEIKVAQYVSKMIKPLNRHRKVSGNRTVILVS